MDITFDCPNCGQELVVDSSYTGIEIECPECETKIVVPETGKEETEGIEEVNAEATASESNEEKPAMPTGVINAMATSAAAREQKKFTVPVHDKKVEEKLIKKAAAPLAPLSKWEKGVAVRTIRRIDCMEVGKDHFDERVTEFLNEITHERVISIQSISYTAMDLATKQPMVDYGVMIVFRIPEKGAGKA